MKQTIVILILNLIVFVKEGSCQSNPCPEVFQFKSDGLKKYGIITIPPPGKGVTYLEIEIGVHGPYIGTTKLELVKSLDETIDDADNGKDIQYLYQFPQSRQLPTIRFITLNDRNICDGPKEKASRFWNQHEIQNPRGATELSRIPYREPSRPRPTISNPRPVSRPTSNPVPPIIQSNDGSWLNSLPFAGTCGKTQHLTQLIIGGTDVNKGEYPWMVALFHFVGRTTEFKCGGSLISNTYVMTAAHCTRNQERIYMQMGIYDISKPFEEDFTPRISKNIIAHADYKPGEAHADVALIEIEYIVFTPKISPICLWATPDKDLWQGTITGWGQLDNDGSTSTTPMQLNVSMVGLFMCRNSVEILQSLATDNTFCAGGKSSGPCKGDSGGGFYVRHRNVYFLRGIVSHSLGNAYTCNVDEYAVYTDITNFLGWMKPYLMP